MKRLYLRIGDRVTHLRHYSWGTGEVVEEKHSTLPGGSCLVRILFEDGTERSFINDLNHEFCCYYAGIRVKGQRNLWDT
jgi:septin family protein